MDYYTMSTNQLVQACADPDNTDAWKELQKRVRRRILLVVSRIASKHGERSMDILDDLVQQTNVRLCSNECKLIREFQPLHDHAADGLIDDLATKTALDHYRRQAVKKRGSGKLEVTGDLAHLAENLPDSTAESSIERKTLLNELTRILHLSLRQSPLAGRDELIFRLYFHDGWTTREIATVEKFGLGLDGVRSSLHRTRSLLRNLVSPVEKREPQKALLR